jgi:hypothetical protein
MAETVYRSIKRTSREDAEKLDTARYKKEKEDFKKEIKRRAMSSGKVGRPAGVMKHQSPFNGQPISATEFYKQMRAFRRVQAQQAEKVQAVRQAQFAKQGVPPQQIQQVIMQRQMQQAQMAKQQMPQQQQMQRPQMQPQQFPAQQVPMGSRGLVGRRVPSKLKFINQIENGTYQVYQPFQQKWW